MQQLKVLLSLLIIVVAMLGIADAGYLTYEKLVGVLPQCAPGYDCGKVLNSPWAQIGPIPLSAFGLVYYATVFTLGLLNYLHKPQHIFLLGITSLGFAFSGYLVFLMAIIIKAWCFYCLISAGLSTTLFILSSSLFALHRHESTRV